MRGGDGAIALDERVVALPATPYRGIQPFRYVDHPIFFAREEEARYLARLVAMYRGVLLYGDSGNGKSSLINAALLPEATTMGFHPERVRVQPRRGEELVIERIPTADDDSEWLPSHLAPSDDHSTRAVLSTELFEERVRAACSAGQRPLLIFDQFEEILTLFEEPGGPESQRRIVALLITLLREPLAVKLVFAFREDYLGKVTQLLAAVPELVDQAVRLGPPTPDALWTIIRGPFERYPGHFARELAPEVARPLCTALAQRFGTGDLSLSEVQTVCLRLWEADDPEKLLAERGVQGLLEDYLGEALEAFSPDLRRAAVALLGQMVTSAGTRNVISAGDLVQRVRAEEDIPSRVLEEALDGLERQSRLVSRERRRDLYLYEITSEFLVPWITRRREELNRARERRRLVVRFGSIAGALLVVVAVVAAIAVWALGQRNEAQRQRNEAQRQSNRAAALALSSRTATLLQSRPDVSVLLALAAFRASPDTVEPRSSLLAALPAVQRGGSLAILHGHDGAVTDVAFSPDGRTLASASDDDTIWLWDVATHRPLGPPLTGHDDAVNSVAFSADGKILASASADKTIRLWDVRARKPLGRPLSGHAGSVKRVAFSSDRRTLASASEDGTVRLWDTRSRRQLGRPLDLDGPLVFSVAFSPDGNTLAIAGFATQLWDVRTHRRVTLWDVRRTGPQGNMGVALSVSFSPDGKTLVVGTSAGTALWDIRSGRRIGRLGETKGRRGGQRSIVSSVAVGPDGRRLASAEGRAIRLWNVRTQHQLGPRLTGHADSVASVAFSADGRTLASASSDGTIRLWDARRRTRPNAPLTGEGSALGVGFSPDGGILASAGANGTVRLWDTQTHKPLGRRLTGHTDSVESVGFSPDGKLLASGGDDNTVRLWDIRTRRQLGRPLSGHGDWVNSVAFSPDGKLLASGSDDSSVRLWDTRTRRQLGRPLSGHNDWVNSVAFSPDGKLLASASDDATVRLWDTATRKSLGRLTGHASFVYSVAFSPGGRMLASASEDSTIRLWDVRTRKQVGSPLTGHGKPVNAVAFSPDGRTLASASADKTSRLWDLASRTQFGPPLTGHTRTVNAVAFSPDGKTLASASGDKSIRLRNAIPWRDFAGLSNEICKVVGDLTEAEWDRYVADIPYRRSCPRRRGG